MLKNREAYLCLSAMLRAREGKMLNAERAERMLEAATFEDAAKLLTDAQAQAKQMLADAESEGKAEIEAAVARAEKELRVLRQKSDVKSVEDAKKLLNELETKKAVLQAGAEAKLDAAASLVAERVVKG